MFSHHRFAATRRACPIAKTLTFETLEPRIALAGLVAQYFHNPDFTGLAVSRVENVSFNWGVASPAPGIEGDSFSVRWTGQIEPEFSEVYTFRILSDEQVRVWVDGKLLIDDWDPHPRRFQTASIELTAGQRYDIRIDYVELTEAAQIQLAWSSPSQPLEAVPADRLFESPAGLFARYVEQAGAVVERIDPNVDFEWSGAGADPAPPSAGTAITWTGQLRPDFSDLYAFALDASGPARLWIGATLVVDGASEAARSAGQKQLEAGKWYDIHLEYLVADARPAITWSWASPRQTADEFEALSTESLRAAKATPVTFTNPLGPGADPFVIRHGDDYLSVRSQGNTIRIDRAARLYEIHSSHPASDTVTAWTAPPGTHYSHQLWAPELHRIGESWYIYVAASDGDNATHRMHVLERNDPDPFGPFTYKGQLAAHTDRWAIDGTVLEWQGQLYFVWSGWPGFSDGQQNLYIAEMRNPWTLRTDRVLLATPQYAWEKHGLAINEGPQILVHDGQLHIIYSGSGYWTRQYSLGRITYNGTGSLLNPASWTKSPQPVFTATSEVVGVGHASFTISPDGSENWIVYHAHANPTRFSEDRIVSMQPFTFNEDGTPDFGAPLPPDLPLTAPSESVGQERHFLTGDYNADGSVDDLDYAVWKATFAHAVFPGTSADGNGDGIVDAADYTLWRSNRGATAMTRENLPEASGNASAAAFATSGDDTDQKARIPTQIRSIAIAELYGHALGSALPETTRRSPVISAKVSSTAVPSGDLDLLAMAIQPEPWNRGSGLAPPEPDQKSMSTADPSLLADQLDFKARDTPSVRVSPSIAR